MTTKAIDHLPTLITDLDPTNVVICKQVNSGGNQQVALRFPNQYGVSIVRGPHTYGGREGLFELAVLAFDGANYELVYDTPITDDVLGWLTPDELAPIARRVAALPVRG